MKQTLGWTDSLTENGPYDVEAHHNRNQWTFKRRRHRRDAWETYEPYTHDWEALLDLLQRKYQRRRCAWRDVEEVQNHLAKSNPSPQP
jgi:hypothetical protein